MVGVGYVLEVLEGDKSMEVWELGTVREMKPGEFVLGNDGGECASREHTSGDRKPVTR